jgi:uroporphyrinogen decarboxylase-like protein
MNRRERLMATLRGEAVDRPAVSFYEIGGWRHNLDNPDPYNVFNSPDWRPLVQLAEEKTDLILMRSPPSKPAPNNVRDEFFRSETTVDGDSRFTRTTLTVGGRTMTSLRRRDRDVSTVWTIEHLLKDTDDVRAYLQLPDEVFAREYDVAPLKEEERALGDAGILMVDIGDPICEAADLFSMEDYTVFALTEGGLFHGLLEQCARHMLPMVEQVARDLPGRLWRICGSEYASEPYLPPRLYEEYVVGYTGPLVDAIRRHGGFARIHSHGRLRAILPHIRAMGADATDPVEPPPQGDMELIDVRRGYGREMVLFGNIESSDLENLSPRAFEAKVVRALREGTDGEGRGFVLMPSACPYGRTISADTLRNYETMVRLACTWGG